MVNKVDTYSPNIEEKLCTFALSPIVVENHRVYSLYRFHKRLHNQAIELTTTYSVETLAVCLILVELT